MGAFASLWILIALIAYAFAGNAILRSRRVPFALAFTFLALVALTVASTTVYMQQASLAPVESGRWLTAGLADALIMFIALSIVAIPMYFVATKSRALSYVVCIVAAVVSWVFLPAFGLPIACGVGGDCI